MARETRLVKDNDGNDVEVYVDKCVSCKNEMYFPKLQADQIEKIFPFIKEKIEKGTPCMDCVKDQINNGTFNLYSNEEMEFMKKKAEEIRQQQNQ